ncbi:MAG: hypothetical protein DMF87_16030 [Acidobacteria bacterium]|nr:MAG: hypothetical protein DMF88_15560 [Acidobacteriota bacterium]PYR77484.1 MAG: hypothetical protein DMF87_16030 [Acidobacteriota bacterium]
MRNAFLCLFVLVFAAVAAAQSAATLGGSVIDPEGKAVVNATVLVRNESSADLRASSSARSSSIFRFG